MNNPESIECSIHGLQEATFVCQHIVLTLQDGKPKGFWWAVNSSAKRPDAWCSACEAKVQQNDGEWNEESEAFAGVKLLCGLCYDKAKAMNLSSQKSWWQFWKRVY